MLAFALETFCRRSRVTDDDSCLARNFSGRRAKGRENFVALRMNTALFNHDVFIPCLYLKVTLSDDNTCFPMLFDKQ